MSAFFFPLLLQAVLNAAVGTQSLPLASEVSVAIHLLSLRMNLNKANQGSTAIRGQNLTTSSETGL